MRDRAMCCPVAAISIWVAGKPIEDVGREITAYLDEHPRTIRDFDGAAGTSRELNSALVSATRVVNSRISKTEEQWFVERGRSLTLDGDTTTTLDQIPFAM